MTDEKIDLAVLRRFLLRGRNADGGWGYYPGKASRLEPTCWALLALTDADAGVLRQWPVADDLLRERSAAEVNYAFHAVGLLTILALRVDHQIGNARLAGGLERVGGLRIDPAQHNRQDNSLRGWSWMPNTFSWVEPTAWCLLALKRWRRGRGTVVQDGRVTEAEKLLIDRVCGDGGWNYGNSNMLGRELHAYVPTTAVSLLALHDRQTEPAVRRSADYLERLGANERSSLALGLASIALRAFQRSTALVHAALERQLSNTLELENQLGVALSLYALRLEKGDAAAIL